MNRKKMYEKPSLEVVKLQASVAMLEGSGNANLQNYNRNPTPDED